MKLKNRVRAAGILILFAILSFTLPGEAAARGWGVSAFQPLTVVERLLAVWSGSWEKIGSGLDPHGTPGSVPPGEGTTGIGSGLDPSGENTESGSDLNPHGGQ